MTERLPTTDADLEAITVGPVQRLESGGYVLRIREPDWHEHRMFKGPDINVNSHVFSAGNAEIDRMIGFRDRLRTHPDELQRYLNAKRVLAARDWAFVQHYADAKSEVVEEIMARGKREAAGAPG